MAQLKHFTAYSVEANRDSFIPNITNHDLWDYYLRQYAAGFAKVAHGGGEASGAMCSYSGVNGVPSCANNYLLNTVVRQHWERPDAVISTDCGAISDMIDSQVGGITFFVFLLITR